MLTFTQESLALRLFDVGAIKFGAFKLKLHETNPDAPRSPICLNLRTSANRNPGPLIPELMNSIGHELCVVVQTNDIKFDQVMGIPYAGKPFAEALASHLPNKSTRPPLEMKKEETIAGRRISKVTVGSFGTGDIVLLVDDLITRADSKFEAIRMAQEAELIVNDVLVLVDRQQGGFQLLKEAGYRLHSVFPLEGLLELYVSEDRIEQSKADEVLEYIKTA